MSCAACSHRHSCVQSVRTIAHMSLFRCHRYNSHARLPHPWCIATFICPPHRGSPLIHLPVIPHSPLTSSHTRYNTLHNMQSSEALPHSLYISRSHQALSHSLSYIKCKTHFSALTCTPPPVYFMFLCGASYRTAVQRNIMCLPYSYTLAFGALEVLRSQWGKKRLPRVLSID